jgi:C-terminal processing protease CtpA/Prc
MPSRHAITVRLGVTCTLTLLLGLGIRVDAGREGLSSADGAQTPALDATQRARAKLMLNEIKSTIRRTYYDQAFHGLDLNAHFKGAEAKLDTALSLGHAYAIIAQALIDFGDSHTFFIPPDRPATFEQGWRMSLIGDQCFVVAVQPGSDAEAKGLKAGDRLLQMDAFAPTRDQLWKAKYLYYVLSPRRSLKIVIQSPGGPPRPIEVAAKVTPKPKDVTVSLDPLLEGGIMPFEDDSVVRSNRLVRLGDIAIWKLSAFAFGPEDVDPLFDEVVNGARSLVIDMRGNPGGIVKTLEQLTARLFDHDVKIADLKGRKSMKPSVAKKRKTPFTGKTVVLVDSDSASAAEVLARVIQLEKRGLVVGDRSSGSVMQAEHHGLVLEGQGAVGEISLIPYGISVTNADLIMADGKSLEKAGVVPDYVVLPTAADLAAGRDPALAQAVALVGGVLEPLDAGKLFPIEWKKK